ncbi:hypothetical protein ACJQWK_06598 [Exserohilum turcicum]
MRFAPAFILASVFVTASGQFIIGALVLIEFTVEFLEAAEVVATLDATVDIGITADEVESGDILLTAEETSTSGAVTIRSSPHVQEVAHSVSGRLSLQPVPAGASTSTGQFALDVEPFVLNPETAYPHVRVEIDWLADFARTARHGPGSSSTPGFSMSNLRLGRPNYSGYGGRGELNWRIRQSGGRFLADR